MTEGVYGAEGGVRCRDGVRNTEAALSSLSWGSL